MINEFFTYLNRGVSSTYGRFIERSLYKNKPNVEELHTLLIPTADAKFSSLCTEQLLQYVKQSKYAARLEELDPVNTYARDIMTLTEDAYTVINSQDIDVVVLNENQGNPRWAEKSFTVSINPTTLEATVSASGLPTRIYEFTMTNNLSSKILLDNDIYVRFKGVLPVNSFIVSVRYSQKFNRDMGPVLNSINSIAIPWFNTDYNKAYQQSTSTLDTTAILAMNLYEILRNGS